MDQHEAPILSVVIPTYNNAATLPDAIASVRIQKSPCREIIVVDDGSADSTACVLNDLGGPDLRVIRQQNGGPAAARNTGIDAARGEWIAFLDADDLWLPGKLEIQLAALRQHPNAQFCFSGHIMRLPDGTEFALECPPPPRSLLLDLLKGNRLVTPSALVRRDCIAAVGLFDATLRTGEDWDMWMRLAAFFDGVLISQPLVLVRRPSDRNKYSVEMLERCTKRVLERLFSDPRVERKHPELAGLRKRVYAWQHSVLAKSYFRHGQLFQSGRRAFAAIRSHPSGLRYLQRGVATPW